MASLLLNLFLGDVLNLAHWEQLHLLLSAWHLSVESCVLFDQVLLGWHQSSLHWLLLGAIPEEGQLFS